MRTLQQSARSTCQINAQTDNLSVIVMVKVLLAGEYQCFRHKILWYH